MLPKCPGRYGKFKLPEGKKHYINDIMTYHEHQDLILNGARTTNLPRPLTEITIIGLANEGLKIGLKFKGFSL